MPVGVCGTSDCWNTGRLRVGLCGACYQWQQKNPGKDPAGRARLTKPPADGKCTITEDGIKCTGDHVARGMCNRHHRRFQTHGDATTTLTRPKGSLLSDLAATAVLDTDDCVTLSGYASRPSVPFNGKTVFASRAAWIIHRGDPGDAFVLHSCNGGSGATGCINLRHLYLGDRSQNGRDASAAGNSPLPHLRGEDVHCATLDEDQVREIRRRWATGLVTQKALAEEYGVSRALMSLLINRKRWKHVD